MLRTPTHIFEIDTNATTAITTTTAATANSTPVIEKLQTAGTTKYQYHDQYTKSNNDYNKGQTAVQTVKQLQQSFIYQHQQQQLEKEQKYHQLETLATTTPVEYKLQTKKQKQKQKQLQATKTNSCNKKLKKSKEFSTSTSSSSSSSTTSSISSSSCSAISITSNDSSTVSAKTTKTNSSLSSSSSSSLTSSPLAASQTTFTFKELILSRGLLSTTPFSFMRTKKSKAITTAATTATLTPETPELRKTSKRLFDLEERTTNLNSSNNKNNHNCKTGASNSESNSATATATRTGYFANILNNNCNNNNNNNINNNNNKNNNNTYIKSFTTTNSRSVIITPTPLPPSSLSSSSLLSSLSPTVTTTNTACVVAPTTLLVAVAVPSPPVATKTSMSPTSQTPPSSRTSLFDSCHRKIRLIGGGPVAFLGGLVAKARRKERDGDQNSTDTKLYLEESVLERKLPEADLKALVDLPAGLDYNEWLASHTLALFEHVNLVYGTISEFCTTSGCADMTGPGNRTYLWFDEKGKKTRVAAPQYIDYVMTFTQKTVSDESIFPTKYANEFPSSFESIARKILRLQFHVIAHLYAAHFREIALLGLHTHLNLTFAHLTALHRRFNLIDEKETDVLRDLEVALRLTDDTTGGIAGSGSSQNDPTETNSVSSGSGVGIAGGNGSGCSGSGSGVDTIKGNLLEDVNSVQHNNLIDCNTASQPPICTQPEANTKSQQFGGGGGLIGGILGDLSSGEFGDTMHYCTSAVPANNTSSNQLSTPSQTCSTNITCITAEQQQQSIAGGGGGGGEGGNVTANCNNGAGALNLHLNNNNNNNNHLAHHPHPNTHAHHHHHHNHHNNVHHHHHHHNHPYAQNTGLIQCNASNAPTATNATTSTTTA